jgi:hypothetical protein
VFTTAHTLPVSSTKVAHIFKAKPPVEAEASALFAALCNALYEISLHAASAFITNTLVMTDNAKLKILFSISYSPKKVNLKYIEHKYYCVLV